MVNYNYKCNSEKQVVSLGFVPAHKHENNTVQMKAARPQLFSCCSVVDNAIHRINHYPPDRKIGFASA